MTDEETERNATLAGLKNEPWNPAKPPPHQARRSAPQLPYLPYLPRLVQEPVETRRETCLEEAERLVGGERMQHYGAPDENFQRIADLWSSYLSTPEQFVAIKKNDVCAMFILAKQSRMRSAGFHRDSCTDTAGYARLQEMLQS